MSTLIQDIMNVILYCMWGVVMFSVLHKKWPYKISLPIYALVIALHKLASLFDWIPLRAAVSILIFAVALSVLFTDRPLRRLLLLFGCYVTMSLAELVYAAFVFPPEIVSGGFDAIPSEQQVVICLTYLFGNAVMLYLLMLLFRRAEGNSSKEGLILLVLLVSQYMLFSFSYSTVATDASPAHILMMGIYLLTSIGMDVAVVLTMRATEHRAELAAEKLALETLIAAQETHYQELTEQYESTRKMRHDIANHLYTMQILIENGRTDEAARYADEIGGNAAGSASLAGCMNSVLDAFLSRRLRELEERGVRVTAEIGIPSGLQLSNAELISAFGNLLDNAEDACADAENAFVELRSDYRAPYLRIEMNNSCAKKDTAQNKKRRIPELERGVGTKILRSMAEKQGGEFRLSENDGVCRSELILKETEYAQNSDLR